jgi:hypothetical protein
MRYASEADAPCEGLGVAAVEYDELEAPRAEEGGECLGLREGEAAARHVHEAES